MKLAVMLATLVGITFASQAQAGCPCVALTKIKHEKVVKQHIQAFCLAKLQNDPVTLAKFDESDSPADRLVYISKCNDSCRTECKIPKVLSPMEKAMDAAFEKAIEEEIKREIEKELKEMRKATPKATAAPAATAK